MFEKSCKAMSQAWLIFKMGGSSVVRTSEFISLSLKGYKVIYKCSWVRNADLHLALGGVDQWLDQ